MLKFKAKAKYVCTDDLWYDLFDGGYLKPETLLEDHDAAKVNAAIKVIQDFRKEMDAKKIIDYR